METFYSFTRIQVIANIESDLIITKKGKYMINVEHCIATISLKVIKSNDIFGSKKSEKIIEYKVFYSVFFINFKCDLNNSF